MVEEEDDIPLDNKMADQPKRRRVKKLQFPRRAPSIVVQGREIIYVTADKITCVECPCFPKEDPYAKIKKLNACLKSPLTLYELAAQVIDGMASPDAFGWTVDDVAKWMDLDVGLPQYMACIYDNHINGMRLLMLEDPSILPEINIHNFDHIKTISQSVRKLFGTDFIQFARSVGLPPRYPLTHSTWFQSRTGPNWGIRKNWTRSDVLRWMKIIMPEPVYMDHWDLVWYLKPDYPKVLFARVPTTKHDLVIPHYKPLKEKCLEYMVPRKFRLHPEYPDEKQLIWMEHRPGSPFESDRERMQKKRDKKPTVPIETTLMPQKINLKGLKGKDLILARRLMPRSKFLA